MQASIPSLTPVRRALPERTAPKTRLLATLLAIGALSCTATLSVMPGAAAASSITFDTGSGLVFSVNSANGNLTSLKHHGVELGVSGQAVAQFEAGWSSAKVTTKTFASGSAELITAVNGNVTQYYFARKGDNTIYLATNLAGKLNPGEARLIVRVSSKLLPDSPVAARTVGTNVSVEGSDVFKFPNGTTASKFYSSQRLIAQQPYGASGTAHGVFMIPGTQEMTSGGPFFRDIEVNDASAATNITNYMFSGHAQTEAMRLGLHGPYALAVTDGAKPAATNLDFLSAYIPGLLSVAQRGTVSGTASGSWNGLPVTAALSGPNGQYWGSAASGTFSIPKVRPGTYKVTLYAGELAVGSTKTATVTAGQTSTVALQGSVPLAGTIFQIGTFDGTPQGFRNADKIETMHPSDVRMSPWKIGTFTATTGSATGSAAAGFPMALFKSVNSPVKVAFQLGSVPAKGATLRIATTVAFDGGRPTVAIGGYDAKGNVPAPPDLGSRSVTRGTWRGANQLYSYAIPRSALKVGTNTLTVSVLSGTNGTSFLSPDFVFDALALSPTP